MDKFKQLARNLRDCADAFDAITVWLKDELRENVELIPENEIQATIDEFWTKEGEIDFETEYHRIVEETKEYIVGNFMSFDDVVFAFNELILPSILKHEANHYVKCDTFYADEPMRREEWNNFTDALCKDNRITKKQYNKWVIPDEIEYGR